MIEARVTGLVFGTPQSRQDAAGRTFTSLRVRVAAEDGAAVFLRVVAFDEPTATALLALEDGAQVCLDGTLSIPELDLAAHRLLPLRTPAVDDPLPCLSRGAT